MNKITLFIKAVIATLNMARKSVRSKTSVIDVSLNRPIYTAITVRWPDRRSNYKLLTERVECLTLIDRYGLIEKDVQALSCTSREQAHRFGKAVLNGKMALLDFSGVRDWHIT